MIGSYWYVTMPDGRQQLMQVVSAQPQPQLQAQVVTTQPAAHRAVESSDCEDCCVGCCECCCLCCRCICQTTSSVASCLLCCWLCTELDLIDITD